MCILYIYISILRFLAQGKGFARESRAPGAQGFRSFQMLWSLRTAQNRPVCAQSRSEPLRIAQSAPRAAQSRPERSLGAVRGTAQDRPEPLRVAQSGRAGAPRARPELLRLKSRSESHGVCPEPLRVAQSSSKNQSGSSVSHALCISDARFYFTWFPSSPCMYMHGFALVYIYIYMYILFFVGKSKAQ